VEISSSDDVWLSGFMPGTYYERDEDWLMTCPECRGNGSTGTGALRKKCPKCDGAGRIKRDN